MLIRELQARKIGIIAYHNYYVVCSVFIDVGHSKILPKNHNACLIFCFVITIYNRSAFLHRFFTKSDVLISI